MNIVTRCGGKGGNIYIFTLHFYKSFGGDEFLWGVGGAYVLMSVTPRPPPSRLFHFLSRMVGIKVNSTWIAEICHWEHHCNSLIVRSEDNDISLWSTLVRDHHWIPVRELKGSTTIFEYIIFLCSFVLLLFSFGLSKPLSLFSFSFCSLGTASGPSSCRLCIVTTRCPRQREEHSG